MPQIPDPDKPPDELQRLAEEAGDSTRKVILAAYTKGIRDGINMAGKVAQTAVDGVTALGLDPGLLAGVRDHINLMAFQIEEPQ